MALFDPERRLSNLLSYRLTVFHNKLNVLSLTILGTLAEVNIIEVIFQKHIYLNFKLHFRNDLFHSVYQWGLITTREQGRKCCRT